MLTALLALTIAVQLAAAAALDAAQSQFTSGAQTESMRIRDMDRNADGVVTRAEWQGSDQSFRVHDWNNDGMLSGDEMRPGAVRPGRSRAVERRNPRDPRSADESRGSPNAPGAAPDCDANAARIVDDVYQQVLQRPADAASAGFTQNLVSGRMTVRDIVAQLAKSDEHATRYFWGPMVTSVYRTILNRTPDEQELRQAAADLASRQSQPIDIVGRAARRAANSDEEAVRILYRQLLHREADPAGLRDFTALAGRQGIEAVAREIARSAEYRGQATSSRTIAVDDAVYEDAVRTLYRHVLGRDPDPAGVQAMSRTAIERGVGPVIDTILASPEYDRLYGDQGVPGANTRYCGPSR